MEQLNQIKLRGTVGFVRQQNVNGRMVVHLSVATNYVYKDRNGDPVIETTWHNVTAWEGKSFTNLAKFEKGCKVEVEGRLRGQRYTDSHLSNTNSRDEALSNNLADHSLRPGWLRHEWETRESHPQRIHRDAGPAIR